MKRNDSGKKNQMIGVSTSGAIPPKMNTPCQPYEGISKAASAPPQARPSVKPQNISVTSKARLRSGLNSDDKVIAVGMAPPRPTPVRKRNNTSVPADSA